MNPSSGSLTFNLHGTDRHPGAGLLRIGAHRTGFQHDVPRGTLLPDAEITENAFQYIVRRRHSDQLTQGDQGLPDVEDDEFG